MTPKISVIMPFYNCDKFLDESISSILNQTFKDFEFIIINDASTDGSDLIVRKYIDDSRIVYIKNDSNFGITANLNKGIELASAEIIARMDGDDVSELDRLRKQFDFLAKNLDISFVGGFVTIIDTDGEKIDQRTKPINPEKIKNSAIIYSPLVHPTVMFRKNAVVKLGGYRNKYGKAEDQDLWLRAIYSGYLVSNLSEYILKYRYHENSTSKGAARNAINDYKLRRDTIKYFNLSIGFSKNLNILIQLLLGVVFTGRQRQWFEGQYKRFFYGRK